MIHTLSIVHRRRRPTDSFILTEIGRRRVRLCYIQLREQGFDAWSARGLVLDLIMAGGFAKYVPGPAS